MTNVDTTNASTPKATADKPEISVITVTHNRRNLLLKKLETLQQQTLSPERFEWMIFVNGSTDGTEEALQEVQTPFKTTVVTSPENISVAKARNAAVGASHAYALLFSDDDCLLPPSALSRHLEEQDKGFRVAVGPVAFEHDGNTRLQRLEKAHYWHVNGANTSVPRLAFKAVGGFDESLKGYGMEDVLLGYRLHREGLPFVALSDLRVIHMGPDPRHSGDASKGGGAGRNAMRIAMQHPETALRLGVHPLNLALKRVALWPPYNVVWRRLSPDSYAYERAFLDGALAQRRRGVERA